MKYDLDRVLHLEVLYAKALSVQEVLTHFICLVTTLIGSRLLRYTVHLILVSLVVFPEQNIIIFKLFLSLNFLYYIVIKVHITQTDLCYLFQIKGPLKFDLLELKNLGRHQNKAKYSVSIVSHRQHRELSSGQRNANS